MLKGRDLFDMIKNTLQIGQMNQSAWTAVTANKFSFNLKYL